MAEAVGVSQSAISQIVTGKRHAGPKLLSLLSSHPKVNATWLYGGEGEPLLSPRFDGAADEPHLPIATQPLPGDPTAYKDLLSGRSLAVARSEYAASRYFLELGRQDPIRRDKHRMVAPGDLLLVETVDDIGRNARDFDERLAVAMDRNESPARPHLCDLSFSPASVEEPCDVYEAVFFHQLADPRLHERQVIVTIPERGRATVRNVLRDRHTGRHRVPGQGLHGRHVSRIKPVDIVGIVVKLIRVFE